MIRHPYYHGTAASVVLLLCSVLSCLALLCLPPASSSSLLAEQWQCRLHSLCGPAIGKCRDCRQPLLAGGTSFLPPQSSRAWSTHGPWGECCWRRELCTPRSCGVRVGPSTSVTSTMVWPRTDPGSKGQIKLEAWDRGCTSRGWETPITQTSKVLLISLDLVEFFFFFFPPYWHSVRFRCIH